MEIIHGFYLHNCNPWNMLILSWSIFTASKVCAGSYDYAQVECVGTPGAPTN